MTATTHFNNSDPTKDVPFTVLDRRRYSFFMIDNEVIDDYACLIGIYALGVYTVLSRFANREGICFPSLNTIAKRLGISKPSVITALEALETYGLIVKEHRFNKKGEHISNLYILLEVKKEPLLPVDNSSERERPEVVNEVDQGGKQDLPGGSQPHLPPSQQGLPEQDSTYNKTQKEQDLQQQEPQQDTNKAGNEEPSGPGADNAVVVALIDLGISEKVAEFLAGQYTPEKITEKMGYLAFLTEQQPDRVQNPCGWLRTAIIDDYGKPDGFIPQVEQEQLAAEEEEQAQAQEEQVQVVELQQRSFQERLQAEHEAAILKLRQQYGTTEEDIAFWEEAQQEIKWTMTKDMVSLMANAHILEVKDDTVVIGVERKGEWRQLQHPGTQTAIKRALAYVADREVSLDVREI